MADIALTCRLHKKPGKHVIRVNTGDTVDSLIGEVKQVFGCNEARDIVLWKTEMPNESEDAFTNLILAEGDNLIRLTAGELTRFWGEGRPLEDHTHIIVDSPILEKNAELRSKDNEIDKLRGELELYSDENASDYIITDNSHSGEGYLKDLFYAKIIRINDVLRIKKRYKNKNTYVNVHIQCKVTNFDDGMLSVMLIDRNEEQEKGFFSLAQLEKWLVEHSLDAEDIHISYEHSGDNIEIIRNERLLGSIRMRRNCYIYNQKNRKDSAKLESKQDADLSETLSRLSITDVKDCDSSIDSESNTMSVFDQYETSENMEEGEYVENIKNGAVRLGFIRDKFTQWLSSISDDVLATQTLEYWLLSYVEDLETNTWKEDVSPSTWLSSRFAITPETADTIINSISEEYLQCQTPQYWIKEWILQCTNPVSPEFEAFINSAPANSLVSYGEIPNLFVVDKKPVSGEDDELRLLLHERSYPTLDNHTYYYHTTYRSRAEFIIINGIDVTMYPRNQDFGCSSSFFLNDEYRWATEWGRKLYLNPNLCVILVYDIPKKLLLDYDHLDLTHDHKKWKDVVRKSRNGRPNEADDQGSIYGPQAENVQRLINNRLATPQPSTSKNQLALKVRKLTKRIDKQLVGTIIYRH